MSKRVVTIKMGAPVGRVLTPGIDDRERAKLWLMEHMPHRYFIEVDVIALATEFAAIRAETARDLTIDKEST